MFISKMKLSRRTVLRGMGAAFSLPMLEAMVPALSAAAKPITRFGAVFVPLGERPGYWEPKSTGKDFQFNVIMKPVEQFREHINVVTELCDPLDGHATTVSAWLSGVVPFRTIAENVKSGITIDQVIANKIGQDTPQSSLVLACEQPMTGYHETNFSLAYSSHVSWQSADSPVPTEVYPSLAWDSLFENRGSLRNMSVLDRVMDDANALGRQISSTDKAKLDEYLTSVREVEKRVDGMRKSKEKAEEAG